MPYIKTKIGEHDYHKPACAEYCKMSGEYCPFIRAKRKKIDKIVRWSDLADKKNEVATGIKNSSLKGYYVADFSGKVSNKLPSAGEGETLSPSDENIIEEWNAGGHTCWADGSGFEYDQMSRNVMGPGGPLENVYDISNYGIEHNALQFSRWNAWIDKFQYDYRFGRVSDTNAECILFPNVDNPWMFTEYVFKGIGDDAKKCALKIPEEYVVEPPLYDPITLRMVNSDLSVSEFDDNYLKYSDSCFEDDKDLNGMFRIRQYRQIINWDSLTHWSLNDVNQDKERQFEMNKNNVSLVVNDESLKLYRARIPVQCVKWGEHGNIPPHTLDMTAPKSWLDPASTVTKMKIVYDAVVGSTVDAPYDGKIEWDGNQAYIWTGMAMSPTSVTRMVDGSSITFIEYYSYSGGTKTTVSMPEKMERGEMKALKPSTKIMPDDSHGEYCHGGCGALIGSNGRLCCKYIKNGDYRYSSFFNKDKCLCNAEYGGSGEATKCGGYVATRQHPQIASYQDKRIAADQTNLNKSKEGFARGMLMATTGGVGGALVGAAGMIADNSNILAYYSNLGKRGDVTISYVVRYEPVLGSGAQAQLNKKKYNEFGKGVQIVPGTGKYALDSEANANPFSGGDTNAYDDINTLSFHRFFASVMHCANQKYCNEITGMSHEQGFSFSKRAGGDDDCRYYRNYVNGVEGCPYNCAPKRAIEFAHCANSISAKITNLMLTYNNYGAYYVWDFDPGEYALNTINLYRKVSVNGYEWCIFDSFAVCQRRSDLAVVAVESSSSSNIDYSQAWTGAALLSSPPVDSDEGQNGLELPDGFLLVGEFRTSPSVESVKISANETKNCTRYVASEAFYWFQPLDNNGNRLRKSDNSVLPSLRQHVDENGYWFCKAETFSVPTANSVMIDNDEKFIGGWHPEYKDYSKIGGEFMQDIVSDAEREGQGMGDYVHNGDYTPIPQTVNKKGYWIDESGQYIMDEREIGADEAIANDGSREGSDGGGAVCISFKKTNTEIDGETGKKIQPKVKNAALFSNDPYDFVINVLKKEGRPKFADPDTDSEYSAPPIVNNRYLLPTLRHALHCPHCDYYIPYKYHIGQNENDTGYDERTCPWCGSNYEIITGSTGTGMKDGDTWSEDASIIRKFFKIYAIGNADVWAPPGTAVKTDAYFWRHQAQITNATRKQIVHRLGDSNASAFKVKNGKESGGAYQFNKMSAQSEMTLGYPEGLGKFIKIPVGAETDTNTEMRYGRNYIDWKPTQDACVDGMWNPVMPRHMIPEWYGKSDSGQEDEGVIAPYTNSSDDALKAVSYDQMRIFRNGIEPIYAYTLDTDYSGDYPTYRASYDQRESQSQPIIWQGRRCVISPQVLATTNDEGGGRDSYQTYFSGDWVYGNVREYFPSGYTWWMMKNVIGGRCTNNSGGGYHMDDGGKQFDGRMIGGSGGEYTCGTRTVAKCALSVYGVVPLDKEIIKAYVIVRPSGIDPSKDPIGRSWTGGPVMYCHYHAKKKSHYEDGWQQHLHGTAGYPNDQYFDEDGNFVNPHPGTIIYSSNDIAYQDESTYRLWGRDSLMVSDDRELYYDNNVKNTMTNIPCLYDTAFHRRVGTGKVSVDSYDGTETLGVGYNASSFGSPAGFTMYNLADTDVKRAQKYQYIVVDDNGMIFMKYPDAAMWKTDSTEQIEKTIGTHMSTVELKVSDGTPENVKTYTFRQADSDLYANQMPRQSQEITGYFDMSWSNTKGYVYDEYAVEKSSGGGVWNAPVIYQDNTLNISTDAIIDYDEETNPNGYKGGGKTGQIGEVARCIDVTDIVRSLYNNRIDRTFSANAGCTFDEIRKWSFYSTLALTKLDDDVALQNSCIRYDDGGVDSPYLLTDTVSYPDLDGDATDVPVIDPDGDKCELAEKKSEIVIETMPMTRFVGDGNGKNNAYEIRIGDGDPVSGNIPEGTYNDISTLVGSIKSMFSGCTVEVKSAYKALVTSDKEIEIMQCEGCCYSELGLSPSGGVFSIIQNRVYDVTSCVAGYSPTNLMGSGNGKGWLYDTCSDAFQSFTVDLLRAPLCKSQKDWRYEEGSADYSSVKCPNEGCTAHTMGCSVAANMSNKYFSSSSPYCPLCGASLDGQPGATIIPGDGIMTYDYDAPFSPNPFISKIVVEPRSNGVEITNYRVFAKAYGHDGWMTLANVSYDAVNACYELLGSRSEFSTVLNAQNGRLVVSSNNPVLRARYVKVECDSDMFNYLNSYPISFEDNGNSSSVETGYQVIASGSFSDFGALSFEGIRAYITDSTSDPFSSPTDDVYEIVAAQMVGTEGNRMRISLNRMANIPNGESRYIHFYVPRQVGGINEFKVYGYHYKTEESGDAEGENGEGSGKKYLTITDAEDEFRWKMNTQTTMYKLIEVPTKIMEVSVGTSGSGGISLVEANSIDSLRWTTKESIINQMDYDSDGRPIIVPHTYYRIIGGNYFYDVQTGRIHVPRYDTRGKSWDTFEKDIKELNALKSYIPDTLTVRYWSGNGKSITFNAKADGHGPSYMLEKNAIQEISEETLANLPSNGYSSKLLNIDGSETIPVSIPWICYNNKPATLSVETQSKSNSIQGTTSYSAGEFRKPNFTGKELKDDFDNDDAFVKLFGEHAENCHGQCETEVTLTGAPNQIISGNLHFIARKSTIREVYVGGKTVHYEERTGGLDRGFLIVSCAPSEPGEGGRTTLCYSIPELLIYAKEAKIFTD